MPSRAEDYSKDYTVDGLTYKHGLVDGEIKHLQARFDEVTTP